MILSEKVISIGFKPEHEKYREEYRNQIHDIIRDSYKGIGGYVGLGHGTKEESTAIHHEISNSNMKVVRRHGKVFAVRMYRDLHGRKSIAGGQNGSNQGKEDFVRTMKDDNKLKRSWGEVSGPLEHYAKKLGVPTIPSDQASKILGKNVTIVSPTHYERDIAGTKMKKTIVGHPQLKEGYMSFKEFLDNTDNS